MLPISDLFDFKFEEISRFPGGVYLGDQSFEIIKINRIPDKLNAFEPFTTIIC